MTKAANSNFEHFSDHILPFSIETISVTGRLIRTSKAITEVLDRHNYPESIARLLGEALLLVALIGSGLTLRHRLILQIQGDGAVPLIVAEYTAEDSFRGYADINHEMFERWTGGEDINPFLLLGKGHVAMTIDQGQGMKPYQGIVPIEGESLSKVVLNYIENSDQIMSSLKLHMDQVQEGGQTVWRGAAMILQKLGKTDANMRIAPADETEEEEWNRARSLFQTLQNEELMDASVSQEQILYRLFHEDGVRVFDKKKAHFACSCSRERLYGFLKNNTLESLQSMAEGDNITADCQFCKTQYQFHINEFEA